MTEPMFTTLYLISKEPGQPVVVDVTPGHAQGLVLVDEATYGWWFDQTTLVIDGLCRLADVPGDAQVALIANGVLLIQRDAQDTTRLAAVAWAQHQAKPQR